MGAENMPKESVLGEMPPAYAPSHQIVQQQPVSNNINQPLVGNTDGDWQYDGSACFDNCGLCCCAWFCAAHLYGQISEKSGHGSECGSCCIFHFLSHTCVGGCLVCSLRTFIRKQHGIVGDSCEDCLCGTFCQPCALIQMARQVGAY